MGEKTAAGVEETKSGAGTKDHEREPELKELEEIQNEIALLQENCVMPPNVVYEEENCYCMDIEKSKETVTKRLSNFIMQPLDLIQTADGGYYTIRFIHQSGKMEERQFKSAVLSNARTFKQMLNKENAELSFMGNDVDLEKIKIHMFQEHRKFPRKIGLKHIGLFYQDQKWIYVDTEQTIDQWGQENDKIVAILEENALFNSSLSFIQGATAEQLQQLAYPLFHFNQPIRTVPVIGWCAAAFLKERLNKRKIKLSHLFIHGTAGSGKSETEENVIAPFFGTESSPLACGRVKEFALLKSCSSSNLLPVVLDEYKPATMGRRQFNLISELLRNAYDGHTIQRGNPDQSVTNYKYRAPVVILGEASTEEKAAKERSIQVIYGKKDRTEEHTGHFFFLKEHRESISHMGRSLLNKALSLTEEELTSLIERSRAFETSGYESRNINGMSCILLGINFLRMIYEDHGLNFEKLTGLQEKDFIHYITGNMDKSLDERGRSVSTEEQILECFDTMTGSYPAVCEYIRVVPQKNEVYIYLKKLYPLFLRYYREFNLQAEFDCMTKADFISQIKETDYFKIYDKRIIVLKEDFEKKTLKVKCLVLHLDMIEQNLDVSFMRGSPLDIDKDGFQTNLIEEEIEQIPYPE